MLKNIYIPESTHSVNPILVVGTCWCRPNIDTLEQLRKLEGRQCCARNSTIYSLNAQFEDLKRTRQNLVVRTTTFLVLGRSISLSRSQARKAGECPSVSLTYTSNTHLFAYIELLNQKGQRGGKILKDGGRVFGRGIVPLERGKLPLHRS